ncbi:hypothetical protein MJO63_26335 (plasmid) [Mycobacterium ulcerans]|uniref:Uncharacterized protein n=1 Tax=Mycobacterium ulcerans TaxID=1809 RepID=A0ABY5TSL1_MYCUL|nr:hypothetical protein [Mycobacterium ulcerans]UDM37023.1 hypothetical protein LH162_25780 [Mycobacterium ulcerans]UVY90007.1 hypothetical protein MJO63_26335 [Mycobacterium ulcerans]
MPDVELFAACGRVSQRQFDIDVIDYASTVVAGGVNGASLSGQQFYAGVGSAAVAGVDASSIAAAQLARFALFSVVNVDVGQRQWLRQSHFGDRVGQCVVGGMSGAADAALRLGEHVVALPRRSRRGYGGDHLLGLGCDPFVIDAFDLASRPGKDRASATDTVQRSHAG